MTKVISIIHFSCTVVEDRMHEYVDDAPKPYPLLATKLINIKQCQHSY